MNNDTPFERRLVPAGAPIAVPPGAVSSPFAMARQYAGDRIDLDRQDTESPAPPARQEQPVMEKTPAPRGRPRGPGTVTRAKDTLKACGPLTVEQLAEGLGIELKAARTLVKNGIQRKLWKLVPHEGVEKVALVQAGTDKPKSEVPSGFKRHLAKNGSAAKAPKPAARRAPAAAPRAHIEEPQAQFALYNTGIFRIEFDGQEMKLPRRVTRAMVDYLDKIAAALQEDA